MRNTKKRKEDRDRLEALVSIPEVMDPECVYGTLVGAFIIYSPDDIKIELYENVGTHGDNTGVIKMRYDKMRRDLVMCEYKRW